MIFFDFDGTIVDIWPRYYQVFLSASGISGITLSQYRRVKQTEVSDLKTARYFGKELSDTYFDLKRVLLEDTEYLRLDTLLVPPETLTAFFSKFDCRILTCRRQPQSFLRELEDLGLGRLANRSIILNPDLQISKKKFLAQNFPPSSHIVIGDSQAEWETAFLENVRSVFVRTGLRKPEDFPLTARHQVVPSALSFISTYMERGIQPWASKKS